jgi:hypothetical protein
MRRKRSLSIDVELDLRRDCYELAREMIWLEDWAKDAAELHRFDRVAELNERRDQVREERSYLLRQLWHR